MSILADLCFRFQAQPENLATEALAILLNEPLLGEAFRKFVGSETGTAELPALTFKVQVSAADGSRPDITGADPSGKETAIIETKFWAGLTDKQPNAYIDQLPADGGGYLVVVAPAIRHEILWNELLRRVGDGHMDQRPSGLAGSRVILVRGRWLVLASWRSLLYAMRVAATAANSVRQADIQQLEDLASRMDTEAFLPLHQSELAPHLGQRFWQYTEVIDALLAAVVKARVATEVSRKSGGAGYYGASILVKKWWLFVEVSAWHWSLYAATPFWLIFPADTAEWPTLKAALAPLAMANPPRLFTDVKFRNPPCMPLFPLVGAEKDALVESLLEQIRHISAYVPTREQAPPVPLQPPAL